MIPLTPPSCQPSGTRSSGVPALIRLFIILAVAFSSAHAQTKYILIAGHGLTNRTGTSNTATSVQDIIAECQATGPWMRFVEREYPWFELQGSGTGNNPGSFKLDATTGIGRIVQDAIDCNNVGLKLRVMITHKFAEVPTFLTHNWTYATGNQNTNPKETKNIKLDKPEVLQFLKDLYAKVILELQASPGAMAGFYGFVIQEHELGTAAYWDGGDGLRRSRWLTNLMAFHDWLAAPGTSSKPTLYNFNSSSATKPHRLFWQMINSPTPDLQAIIASMPVGGGICGPDVFPREPGPAPGLPERGALYRAYNEMRNAQDLFPMSLHVYHMNYWNPYVHAAKNDVDTTQTNPKDLNPLLGPQPIWGRNPGASSYNGTPNGNAGVGIANFVGSVLASQQDPDNIRVNNLVWSWTDAPPSEVIYQTPNQAPYGWTNVKNWMKNSVNQFDRAANSSGFYNGGLNTVVPDSILDP